jgi:hypothetical protein
MALTVQRGTWVRVLIKALAFSAASNAAVLFVFWYGKFFWPEGLPAWAHHIFWLASGVNLAGVLLLGIRYAPVILLDAIPVCLLLGAAWETSLVGAAINMIEAAVAAGAIRAIHGGNVTLCLNQLKPTATLLGVSLIGSWVTALLFPVYLILRGQMPAAEIWNALGNWNLANAAGMLLVSPLVWSLYRRAWNWPGASGEFACTLASMLALSLAAFGAAFSGLGINFTFLVFPPVIYAAVRFGWAEVSAVLGMMVAMIYVTLGWNAHILKPDEQVAAIWSVQAFSWGLAATGFLISALTTQRREVERHAMIERERALQASLYAERMRLAALRYQINPHFIFNALNSVRAALPLTEAVARDMLTDLSGYLRSTLAADEVEMVTLSEEVRSVQEYLRIEQHRFGARLQTRVEIDPDAVGKKVPVFILQPLVENSIRHGLEKMKGVCEIAIMGCVVESNLVLEVRNSGVWRPEEIERRGVGLKNVRHRLDLVYSGRASLNIETGDGRVGINIVVPA